MVLNRYRDRVDVYVARLSVPFMNISPNKITGVSVILSILAALSLVIASGLDHAFLLLASLLVFAASTLDAVDGKVARLTGKESKLGDFVDHVSDRYSDLLLIAALAFTSYASAEIVLFALTGVFMVSYMGTQAQAVGCPRDYGGMLGRADRLVIMILVLPIQFVMQFTGNEVLWEFTMVEWMLLLFAVAGHITALQRFCRSWKALSEPGCIDSATAPVSDDTESCKGEDASSKTKPDDESTEESTESTEESKDCTEESKD